MCMNSVFLKTRFFIQTDFPCSSTVLNPLAADRREISLNSFIRLDRRYSSWISDISCGSGGSSEREVAAFRFLCSRWRFPSSNTRFA